MEGQFPKQIFLGDEWWIFVVFYVESKNLQMEVWFLMTQKSLMIHKSFIVLRVLSNESVEFDDPKECDDPQISNEPKGISIGRKYLDLVIQNSF